MLKCARCGELLNIQRFSPDSSKARGYKSWCKECDAKRVRAAKYGLTIHELEETLVRFENRCAICHSDKSLCIDHDHDTREVRGVLCSDCNLGLGRFKDDTELLNRAIQYLILYSS